jgi:Lipase (class 3)
MIPAIPLQIDLTSDFTVRNASSLALASQWAYTLTPQIEGVLTDSQGIFFDAGPAYVLAFKGTTDLRDWLTDCKFLLRPVPGFAGKIHDGFADALNDVCKDTLAIVQTAMAVQVKPIFVAGHSLGGALAVLAADWLARENIAIQAVYTFGQPRAGDRAFAAGYNARLGNRTYRLVYEADLVPHVPLPGLLFRYLQNRSEVFLLEHFAGIPRLQFNRPVVQKLFADAVMCYHAWRLLRFCAGNPVAMPFALLTAIKANHAIGNYIAKLNAL